jgi:hypothetical protein
MRMVTTIVIVVDDVARFGIEHIVPRLERMNESDEITRCITHKKSCTQDYFQVSYR